MFGSFFWGGGGGLLLHHKDYYQVFCGVGESEWVLSIQVLEGGLGHFPEISFGGCQSTCV